MFSGFIWPCLFHLTQCVLDALTDTPQTTAIYSESLWCIQRVSRPASFFFQPQPLFSLTMAPLTTAHDRCTTARVRAQKCRLRIGKTTQHQHWRGRSGTTVKDPDNEETVDTHSDVASEAAFTGGCVGGSMPSWTKPNLQHLFSETVRRWLRGPPPSCISARRAMQGGLPLGATNREMCTSPTAASVSRTR